MCGGFFIFFLGFFCIDIDFFFFFGFVVVFGDAVFVVGWGVFVVTAFLFCLLKNIPFSF